MQTVKRIFEELQSTNSKLDKERIIKANADNRLFKETLKFLLNPYIVTGLSAKKINKHVTPCGANFADLEAETVMGVLQINNTGSDKVIDSVQTFISAQPDDMQDFYKGLFTKSITLGCAASTVNKALGKGFIPTFEVQLAEKYFDFAHKVDGKEFTLTTKLDGMSFVNCTIQSPYKTLCSIIIGGGEIIGSAFS